MQPIALVGRTLTVSNISPTTVTFTPTYKDTPALRTSGKVGAAVLIDKIDIKFTCGGTAAGGNYSGIGTAQLVAQTARVECEGRQMLKEGDFINVTCMGTVTHPDMT